MAIAEDLSRDYAAMEEKAEGAAKVRVAVHDASRVEWSVSVPLPDDRPIEYLLNVALEIPNNAFVRHSPWDQMQAFTRLDGPHLTEAMRSGDDVTIDHLRRGALAMASQLARAADGFSRHCRLAGSLFATAPHSELEDALTIWIEAALRIAEEAREKLATPTKGEADELVRERRLVDEYISVRLFEMLAGAERALSGVMRSKSPNADRLAPVVADVEARLAEVMSLELSYRETQGFANADPGDASALEHYLDRASRLKKHFQEVLFLEPETYQVAERAYHWVAAFFAVIASTWAFAWQIALINQANATTTLNLSSGVLTLALIAGVVYAAKDRIKEIGRNWMTHRMHRVWGAQRVTRYRAPERRLSDRDVVATARESFEQKTRELADTLNPHCTARRTVTVLSYEHKGQVLPNAPLRGSGVRRVKHVFRYDLSPMFARLDDAVKPVPVLDGKRVRFIDAPRCYRVPFSVTIMCGGRKTVEHSILVLHKRGLERLEREKDSNPSLAEVGLEPN
jgi:hypothetical protein